MTTPDLTPGADEAPIRVELDESRYDRQQRVSWWDQERLARARVLVAGAGALGNEVVKNLVLLGVGHIVVVDGDVVESSNLARCIFFRAADEGRPKAIVLAERAAEVNPDVSVVGIQGDLRSLGTGIALRADVMVGALDNREARLHLNRLAARTARAWVDGAIEALTGVGRVFSPPAVCYECTLAEADWEALAHRQSCRLLTRDEMQLGKVPTTASTSSVVAGIQSQEVVKLLHGDLDGVRPLEGGIVFDGAHNDSYPLTYPSDPECLAHQHFEGYLTAPLDTAAFAEVTALDVVERAWPEAAGDPTARFLVDLGDDHVVAWTCPDCGTTVTDGRPASLVAWGDGTCTDCGSPRQPEIVTSVQVPGARAGTPLASLGVRADEILAVRHADDERYLWLAAPDPRLPATWTRAPPAEIPTPVAAR